MASIQTTKAFRMKSATISNAAKAISHADFAWTAGDLVQADRAILTARTAGVMYTYDGTDPTTTLGHLLPRDGTVEILGTANVQALKFIREAGADATLTVTLES